MGELLECYVTVRVLAVCQAVNVIVLATLLGLAGRQLHELRARASRPST